MMSDQGVVFGIEHIPELYELGIKNISKSHLKLLEDKIINLVEGDGRLGIKDKAPFNCIHVGAGKIY
jgi:protein-L-isoaspartate(D-aspartate) O-methyltransferase